MRFRTSVSVTLLVLVVIGGALAVGLSAGKTPPSGCKAAGTPAHYTMVVKDAQVLPDTIHGKQCDTLTIVNKDNLAREVAFGPHEDHVPYDGVAERVLNQGQSLTVTLNQTGSFRWHDHLHDEVQGYFTVND